MVALKEEMASEIVLQTAVCSEVPLTSSVPALGQGRRRRSSTTKATTTTRTERYVLSPQEKHLTDKLEFLGKFQYQARKWYAGIRRQAIVLTDHGANIA